MADRIVELTVRVQAIVSAENATDTELAVAIVRDPESVRGGIASIIERAGYGGGRERDAGWVDESRQMFVIGIIGCEVPEGAGMAVVA
jgi:hypothetical protein